MNLLNRSGMKQLGAIVLLAAVSAQAHALAIRTDAGFDANVFGGNDDGSITVNTGFNFNFFGISGPNLFLNNNGNVTFGSSLSTFTPFGITAGSTAMIAPFFSDVDTRGIGEPVTYGNSIIGGHNAFGVNWDNVAHFSQAAPLNSFQLVMIDRSDIGAGDFDFEFNFDSILWEAGTASGSNGSGLGGTSARSGFTNGAGTFFELNGSGVNGAFLDSGPAATSLINNSLNSVVDGRYTFRVRNGVVQPPTGVPAPSVLALLSLGLIGVSFARRNRQKA
ncbi:MAG: nidogen-like domain-containing protein [Methylococcales bacterium]